MQIDPSPQPGAGRLGLRQWLEWLARQLRWMAGPGITINRNHDLIIAAVIGDLHRLGAHRSRRSHDSSAQVLLGRRGLERTKSLVVACAGDHRREISSLLDIKASDTRAIHLDLRRGNTHQHKCNKDYVTHFRNYKTRFHDSYSFSSVIQSLFPGPHLHLSPGAIPPTSN